MNYMLIFVSVILFTIQTICFKEFNRTHMKNLASYFIFNFSYFSMVVAIFLVAGRGMEKSHPYTILLGIAFGVLFVTTMLIYMKAMEIGPLAYTTLFFSFGLLIPVVVGTIFWNETVSALQIAGLGLLLVTFYLGSTSVQNPGKKVNFRWMVLCIIAFIGNGGLMILAKEHQVLLPNRQVNEFLILSFGTAALLSLLLFFPYHFGKGQSVTHLKNSSFYLIITGAGLTTAFGNQLALYLAVRIPSVIQFPSVNGGVVILSTIFSGLLFHEKLTPKGILGLGMGIGALILLGVKP